MDSHSILFKQFNSRMLSMKLEYLDLFGNMSKDTQTLVQMYTDNIYTVK